MVVFSIEFNFEDAVQLQITKNSFLYSFKQWNRALTLMLYSTATRPSSIFGIIHRFWATYRKVPDKNRLDLMASRLRFIFVGRFPLNRRFFSRNRRISRIVLRALY